MTKLDDNNLEDRILVTDDEKKRVLDLYDTEIPIPAGIGIFDSPTRCYEINVQWASIVMGFASWLTEIAAWKQAQDENYIAIQEISKFLQGKECEVPTLLRQNPADNCQLQYSIDDGETWSLAFDYSLCTSIVDGASETSQQILIQAQVNNYYSTSYQTFQENIYNNYVTNYVDSITNIYPELAYGDSDDSNRDDALCYALGQFVDAVCNAAIAYFDDLDETALDLQRSLAIAAAITGIIALAATGVGTPAALALAAQAGLWSAGIGLGTALGSSLFNHFTSTNKAAYEDTAARQEVVCCLFDAMMGMNADQADLQAAFGGCSLSANAEAIHDAAQILAAEDATYAAFAEKLAIGFQSAKLGLLPECPCTITGWCYEISPEDNQYGVAMMNVGSQVGDGLLGVTLPNNTGNVIQVPNWEGTTRYYAGIIFDLGELYLLDHLSVTIEYSYSGTLGLNDILRIYIFQDLFNPPGYGLLYQNVLSANGSHLIWVRNIDVPQNSRYLYIDARSAPEGITIHKVTLLDGVYVKPVGIPSSNC